ncbi:unnamed protein product, partial [Urochloa humidicola]
HIADSRWRRPSVSIYIPQARPPLLHPPPLLLHPHAALPLSSPSPSPASPPHLSALLSTIHAAAPPRAAPLRAPSGPTTATATGQIGGKGGHRPAMTSAVATTVGCGGLPFRPSSVARPRGRWVVRAQAAGSDASEDKSVEIMRKFSEQYARRTNTFFCADKTVTAVVIKGLADHKDTLGAPLCPCRHYDDKAAEVAQGFWNCPCVPMRERKECHCMLFLTPENDFAGKDQAISLEEIKEATSKF